ncbi:MAG TPA: NAD(P)/FAD-dependent oxidoreductase [Solirubrobacterales bacterium]|jgi:putative flavoprotein involved in K+ transport|nr:NAD(P)/FAD-dependent oxidoreductase [Solirubrobacterales bacterium]
MADSEISAIAPPADVARAWIAGFAEALASGDVGAIADRLVDDAWWRDVVALTWDIRSLHGREDVERFLGQAAAPDRIRDLDDAGLPEPALVDGGPNSQYVEAFFGFRTDLGGGIGVARLVEAEPGRWRAWTLMTALRELDGYELAVGPNRERHPARREIAPPTSRRGRGFIDADPEVLIVGAGQAGLGLAAHLRLMGVPTLVIERNARIGDNWRNRYDALVLHDPVWANSLPFMPFPDSWPVYMRKDKIADWFENYVSAMEIDAWTDIELLDATYSESERIWTARLRLGEGEERTLRPRQLVMATGTLTEPNRPEFPDEHKFGGTAIHSSRFRAGEEWREKRAVVIGVCNSGQDLARDLVAHGAEVTLLQRSPVYVYSQERGLPLMLGGVYAEGGPPTGIADLMTLATPNPVLLEIGDELAKAQRQVDAEMLVGLEGRGFLVDDGVGKGGPFGFALRRGGGFVLDVGTSKQIVDGSIAIATGSVARFTERGLMLDSEVELEADLVVFATGYKNMRESARAIFGDAVADRCGDVWGLDEEGELRSIWRPSGHPGFWFTGGNLLNARIFSRYLALQIAAALEGIA